MNQSYYGFDEKLAEGLDGERLMDDFYREWFIITKISVYQQKKEHYDRIFKPIEDKSKIIKVEYKNDIRALETGNFFIETESSVNNIRGWIYESHAEWFSILIGNKIYLTDTMLLRYYFNQNINRLTKKQTKPTQLSSGYTYHSCGYLLPLKELEIISNIFIL